MAAGVGAANCVSRFFHDEEVALEAKIDVGSGFQNFRREAAKLVHERAGDGEVLGMDWNVFGGHRWSEANVVFWRISWAGS